MPPTSESATSPDDYELPVRVGQTIAGRYQVQAVIGRGSTSVVYKAQHLALECSVAVKIFSASEDLPPDECSGDRFEFEAKLLAGLRHPSIVTVHDFGRTERGALFIAMELLRGETLAAYLRRRVKLPPAEAVDIAARVAEALSALHERGILHRDIKPSNVFLLDDGQRASHVKLVDFGLARPMTPDPARPTLEDDPPPRRQLHTRRGVILGSAGYMSPELIECRELDPRSDIYALGVLTYRMLTGHPPVSGRQMLEVLGNHILQPVEPMRQRAPDCGIPVALDEVVLSALEKEREHRPRTAREFSTRLRAALAEGVTEPATEIPITVPTGSHEQAGSLRGSPARQHRIRLGVLGILGLALLLLAFSFSRSARSGHGASAPATRSHLQRPDSHPKTDSHTLRNAATRPSATRVPASREDPPVRVRAIRRSPAATPTAKLSDTSLRRDLPAAVVRETDFKTPTWNESR